MDWYSFALMDYRFYADPNRIKQYVINQKISTEQFQSITGEIYT